MQLTMAFICKTILSYYYSMVNCDYGEIIDQRPNIAKSREPVAVPGLFALLLVFHRLADFLTKQALDFILHCLGAGSAEMCPHPVGGLADFLHQRGRGLRRGLGVGDGFGDDRFVAHSSPFSVTACRWLAVDDVMICRAAALVVAALSSRKFFPAKRMGAQRSKIRS